MTRAHGDTNSTDIDCLICTHLDGDHWGNHELFEARIRSSTQKVADLVRRKGKGSELVVYGYDCEQWTSLRPAQGFLA